MEDLAGLLVMAFLLNPLDESLGYISLTIFPDCHS